MDSLTKVQNMFELKKPSDRREIPVFPQIISWCGTAAGMTQAEIISSDKKWHEAMAKTFRLIGKPDMVFAVSIGRAVFAEAMPARLPGRELPDDALYQFIETQNMEYEDYDFITKNGWNAFYYPYMMRIQNPPMKSMLQLMPKLIALGLHINSNTKRYRKQDMATSFNYAVYPAFDMISLIRSVEPFLMDVVEDEEGVIHDALRRATPEIIKDSITNTKRFKGDKICVFAMRSSCSFLSPTLFEEYSWPYLKQMIEDYHKAGIRTILHADGNWLPVLKYFRELPKGCVHFELDGATDIFKAYEELDGWQSMRGDVPATMFAFGKPEEVSEYCEKLITELGMRGGFMLGSGCEVPLNAKAENVKAMIDAVR